MEYDGMSRSNEKKGLSYQKIQQARHQQLSLNHDYWLQSLITKLLIFHPPSTSPSPLPHQKAILQATIYLIACFSHLTS